MRKKQKFCKKRIFKLGTLLFAMSFLLWNCQEESITDELTISETEISTNENTISFEQAKDYFQNNKPKNLSSKNSNDLSVTPDWESIEHKSLFFTESQLTKVKTNINRSGEFTASLFFLNIDGEINNVIYTVYKDSITENGNIVNARIFFNKLDGTFIDGYRVENGVFKSRFLITQKSSSINLTGKIAPLEESIEDPEAEYNTEPGSGTDPGSGDWDCWNTDNLDAYGGSFDEVNITGYSNNSGTTGTTGMTTYYYIPTNIYYNNNTSSPLYYLGGAGSGGSTSAELSESATYFYKATYSLDKQEMVCNGDDIVNPDGYCVKSYMYDTFDDYFANNPEEFTPTFDIDPEDIIDINEYMDCFGAADSTNTFKMTLYVNQPVPGSRDPYKVVNLITQDIDVGHTFISLTMTDSSGISTTQTIGFYPDPNNLPSLSSPSSNGRFRDNEQHIYNVSVSNSISYSQFNNVVNGLRNFSNSTYNLNTLNCTDIAIQIAGDGGLTLPDTTGSWGNFFIGSGAGSNPGDLGEDIRNLGDQSSLSYNPNVVIKTTTGNGAASSGPCN